MAINPVKIHLFNLFVKICPPSRLNSFKVRLLRWAGAQVGKTSQFSHQRYLVSLNLS